MLQALRMDSSGICRRAARGRFGFPVELANAWICTKNTILLLMIMLTACIGAGCDPPVPKRAAANQMTATSAAKRLQFLGFSIIPPAGPGWQLVPGTGAPLLFGFDALFVKMLGTDQIVHVYVVTHRIPTTSSDRMQILEEELGRAISPRGSLLKASPERLSGAVCLRWEMTREGAEPLRGIQTGQAASQLVSWHYGYLCSHPDAPAFLIEIGYFNTIIKRRSEPAIDAEGERFLHGLRFTSLHAHITQGATGAKARGLALWHNDLWVSQEDSGTVERIDSRSGAIINKIRVGAKPEGLAAGLGSVWVPNWASGTVSRIDPETNQILAAIEVGRGPADVAVGFGSVWVTNEKSASVSRLNPVTDRVEATIVTGGRPDAIAAAAGAIWVEDFNTTAIWRISSCCNRVVASIRIGRGRHFIAGDRNVVWVTSAADHTVSKIDPATNRVITTIHVAGVPAGLALAGKSLWVANFSDATVLKIAVDGGAVKELSVPVGENPFLLAGNEKNMWVLDVWEWQYGSLSRIDY